MFPRKRQILVAALTESSRSFRCPVTGWIRPQAGKENPAEAGFSDTSFSANYSKIHYESFVSIQSPLVSCNCTISPSVSNIEAR